MAVLELPLCVRKLKSEPRITVRLNDSHHRHQIRQSPPVENEPIQAPPLKILQWTTFQTESWSLPRLGALPQPRHHRAEFGREAKDER